MVDGLTASEYSKGGIAIMTAIIDKLPRRLVPRLAITLLFLVLLADLFFTGLVPELTRPNEVFGLPRIGLGYDDHHGWFIARNTILTVPYFLAGRVESFATDQQHLVAKTSAGQYMVVAIHGAPETVSTLEEAQSLLAENHANINLPADLKPIATVVPAHPWRMNLPNAILSQTMLILVVGLGWGIWLYASGLSKKNANIACIVLCIVVSELIYTVIGGGGPAAFVNTILNIVLTLVILSLRQSKEPAPPNGDH